MKRRIAIVVLLVIVGGVFLVLRTPAVQDRIVARAFESALSQQRTDLLRDDALRAVVFGSSSPLPAPGRAQTCVVVFAGGLFYVVDVGLGSAGHLGPWRIPAERVGAVLITHQHSDHIAELGEWNLQTWVAGRSAPLRVYGPPGVAQVVAGFEQAYALDRGYRTAHHGSDFLDPALGRMQAIEFAAPSAGPQTVLEENGVRITTFRVDHSPVSPAVGYRFDYGGRSLVLSGDTVKVPEIVAVARDADVLFHEALVAHVVSLGVEAAGRVGRERPAHVLHDILDYHTTPVEAAQVANEANVGLLVLYHLAPAPFNALLERVFLRGVAEVRPDGVMLAEDGLLIELPTGSDEIVVGAID